MKENGILSIENESMKPEANCLTRLGPERRVKVSCRSERKNVNGQVKFKLRPVISSRRTDIRRFSLSFPLFEDYKYSKVVSLPFRVAKKDHFLF